MPWLELEEGFCEAHSLSFFLWLVGGCYIQQTSRLIMMFIDRSACRA